MIRRAFLAATAAFSISGLPFSGPPCYELTLSGRAVGTRIGPTTTVISAVEAREWLRVMRPVGGGEYVATGAAFGDGAMFPEMTYRLRVR